MKESKEALNLRAGVLLLRVERMGKSAKDLQKIQNLEQKYRIKPEHKANTMPEGPRILRTSGGGYVWR